MKNLTWPQIEECIATLRPVVSQLSEIANQVAFYNLPVEVQQYIGNVAAGKQTTHGEAVAHWLWKYRFDWDQDDNLHLELRSAAERVCLQSQGQIFKDEKTGKRYRVVEVLDDDE